MQLTLNLPSDILEASISDVGARLRRKELSSEELTRHVINRAVQTQPTLNAFIDIWADSAIAQAKQLDLEAASGSWRGPLHGIPLAHKDCFGCSCASKAANGTTEVIAEIRAIDNRNGCQR